MPAPQVPFRPPQGCKNSTPPVGILICPASYECFSSQRTLRYVNTRMRSSHEMRIPNKSLTLTCSKFASARSKSQAFPSRQSTANFTFRPLRWHTCVTSERWGSGCRRQNPNQSCNRHAKWKQNKKVLEGSMCHEGRRNYSPSDSARFVLGAATDP